MQKPLARVAMLLVSGVLALSGCDSYEDNTEQAPTRSLAEIKESGKLIVLTRNAPTTRYITRDGEPSGPEHDMATAFADWLGVEVEFRVKTSIGEILDALENGQGDIAAAGLTITESRRDRFQFGPSYQPVTQQVVCRRGTAQPESIAELAELDIQVIADSSYVERLEELQAGDYPELEWQAIEDTTTETLLYRVWKTRFDCTVADSTIVNINRRYFPELTAPLNLSSTQHLGWAIPQPRDDVAAAVTRWMEQYRSDGRLSAMQETYYGFFREFDYVDVRTLIRHTQNRLPRYRRWFEQAADEHDLPFALLAAQGYQESHWQANAKSPTGVRGIMMLTRPTAKSVGVDNRLDARQSIFGGARYLAQMKKRFIDAVPEPHRTWLALAAYNVGRAHMHDAQTLARQRGLDPHRWQDIRQVLPLLADPAYYPDLKYGYARGREPVRYVQRIREYKHIIENELK